MERDSPNEVEVNLRRPAGEVVEVALDATLSVVDVEPEHAGDE